MFDFYALVCLSLFIFVLVIVTARDDPAPLTVSDTFTDGISLITREVLFFPILLICDNKQWKTVLKHGELRQFLLGFVLPVLVLHWLHGLFNVFILFLCLVLHYV